MTQLVASTHLDEEEHKPHCPRGEFLADLRAALNPRQVWRVAPSLLPPCRCHLKLVDAKEHVRPG